MREVHQASELDTVVGGWRARGTGAAGLQRALKVGMPG